MTNLDKSPAVMLQEQIAAAQEEGSNEAMCKALATWADNVQQETIKMAKSMVDQNDYAALAARGVRQLTSEENKYYNALIDAMKSNNPQMALSNLDVVMPTTVIDAVFEDLVDNHPLLAAINFQNTNGIIEMIVNTHSRQLATWSPLCAEITKELASGFKKIKMDMDKLSAFIPVCNAMLDLGPAWLDRYVRTILQESIYLGLEEAIINGTGKDMPIGMNRQVGDDVTVTAGVYPLKETVALNSFDPVTYGTLLDGMTTTPNGHYRTVGSVIMVVNPSDYLTKIMPATTVRTADGSWNSNVLPFPTTIIQSVQVPKNRAVIGLANRYFMGIGTAKSGKIEYSDDYHFLEDERVYRVKLYGHGEPLDNNAFVYADITNLKPTVQEVVVRDTVATEVKGTVKTKADTSV